jgi:hypothetical protein
MHTHTDQIWCSEAKEVSIVKEFNQFLTNQGFTAGPSQPDKNFGYPQIYTRSDQTVSCRFVDSVFFDDPESWSRGVIITDNIPFQDIGNRLVSVLPEFWHIWHFEPKYIDRIPTSAYNCFMNRVSGDRSIVFYELIRRGILEQGTVSYNCYRPGDQKDNSQANYDWQYTSAELERYETQHHQGRALIPYNTITDTLEQTIIDSKISLVLETYTSDSHIVFSEKLFRVLQMPRPWLLYCSPYSIDHLRRAGFDVLDDYVDHGYDNIVTHFERLTVILDQLNQSQEYTDVDYVRFRQAAEHNRNLLTQFADAWPQKLKSIKEKL